MNTEVKLKVRPTAVANHRSMVKRLMKSPAEIRYDLTDMDVRLMHDALGIAGEGGEIVDMIKKIAINGNDTFEPLDFLAECGDALFYLVDLLDALGYTLDDALNHNVNKLNTRYPEGYSDAAATARVDVSAPSVCMAQGCLNAAESNEDKCHDCLMDAQEYL